MSLRSNIIGGMTTGGIVACAAYFLGSATTTLVWQILAVSVTFSLFPEIAEKSPAQCWFYRFMFIALIYLSFNNQYKLAISLSIISLLPLLSQSTKWTKSLWTILLTPIVIATIYEFITIKSPVWYQLSFANVQSHLTANLWLIAALIIGWLTNLFINSRI